MANVGGIAANDVSTYLVVPVSCCRTVCGCSEFVAGTSVGVHVKTSMGVGTKLQDEPKQIIVPL